MTLNGVEMVQDSARAASLPALTNGISATGLEPGDVIGFSVRSFDGTDFSAPAQFTVTGTRPEVDFGRETLAVQVQENGPGNLPLPAARATFLDDISYTLSGTDADAFIFDAQTRCRGATTTTSSMVAPRTTVCSATMATTPFWAETVTI